MVLTRTYKFALLGDGGVGKTSLRKRYLGEGFQTNYSMTIGADFAVQKTYIDGDPCRLQIWDLSGQTHFYDVRKVYYKGCNGILLLYDLTIEDTYINIPKWINEFQKNTDNPFIPIVIIGNKSDLLDEKELQEKIESGYKYVGELLDALDNTILFETTSAKTGVAVEKAFTDLVRQCILEEGKSLDL